jgi:DNA-binding NtrC family response regulator
MESRMLDSAGTAAARMASALIVEPEAEMRNFLLRGLQKYFGLVETATSLASANQLRSRCHFDLVVINTGLPDGGGLEWVARLRQEGDAAGVIFLAEDSDIETAIHALRAGAEDFIRKPFHIDQLITSVESFIQRQLVRREKRSADRSVVSVGETQSIIGQSQSVIQLLDIIRRVAPMPSTVLITGESGTGKELAARSLHEQSGRPGSFVAINCGGMSQELLESELFGHARGAFTGAHQSREGLFNFANKGTLFLDEIGEMPLAMQAHLLRVLEERSVRPVGSNQEVAVDVRIVAATNRDLAKMVSEGGFRQDLYFRLNVLTIAMPTLRQRMDDIPLLARHFCRTLSAELGVNPPAINDNELKRLLDYDWPGNVRELKNVIERCLLLNHQPSHCMTLPSASQAAEPAMPDSLLLDDVERQHILRVLEMEGGNKSAAARQLGISRKTLERKVKAWGID